MGGDFNAIIYPADRKCEAPVTTIEVKDFAVRVQNIQVSYHGEESIILGQINNLAVIEFVAESIDYLAI